MSLPAGFLKCAFSVHSELGPFYRESVYHRAIEIALTEEGLEWVSELYFPVEFHGVNVGKGFADIVVDDSVLLELKACESLHPNFVSQMVQYLTGRTTDSAIFSTLVLSDVWSSSALSTNYSVPSLRTLLALWEDLRGRAHSFRR